MESARLAGSAQVWRSPGRDKGLSSEACYLGIRLLSLTMLSALPRTGETQVWNHPNSTKWGNSSMESPGPGELKYGTTQAPLVFFLPDIRR